MIIYVKELMGWYCEKISKKIRILEELVNNLITYYRNI